MSCHHSTLVSELKVLNPKSACSNYPQIESVHRCDFVTIHVAPNVSVLLWQARGCSHHKFDAKQPQKCKMHELSCQEYRDSQNEKETYLKMNNWINRFSQES